MATEPFPHTETGNGWNATPEGVEQVRSFVEQLHLDEGIRLGRAERDAEIRQHIEGEIDVNPQQTMLDRTKVVVLESLLAWIGPGPNELAARAAFKRGRAEERAALEPELQRLRLDNAALLETERSTAFTTRRIFDDGRSVERAATQAILDEMEGRADASSERFRSGWEFAIDELRQRIGGEPAPQSDHSVSDIRQHIEAEIEANEDCSECQAALVYLLAWISEAEPSGAHSPAPETPRD